MPRPLSPREMGFMALGAIVAIALLAGIWFLTEPQAEPMRALGEVNRPAPTFSLTTTDGSAASLEAYRGKIVVINFWGTWCEPCKQETPALQAAYTALRDKGLVVLGVNLTDNERSQGRTEDDVRAFAQQYNVSYPILLDRAGEVTRLYRVFPLPTSFFVDAKGNIRYIQIGELTTADVTTVFQRLQQESAVNVDGRKEERAQ